MTDTPRIYVACLASYNSGTLHGRWIDATDDKDGMYDEINDLLAKSRYPNVIRQKYRDGDGDEHLLDVSSSREIPADWEKVGAAFASAEEWAIHDSEGLGDLREYAGLDEVVARVAIIEVADERNIPAGVLIEAMTEAGATDAEDFCDNHYEGTAETWLAFAQERTEENSDMSAVPEWLQNYIDWESMGRDWRVSGDWTAYRDGETGDLYFFNNH